jgi:hypothetical protein
MAEQNSPSNYCNRYYVLEEDGYKFHLSLYCEDVPNISFVHREEIG